MSDIRKVQIFICCCLYITIYLSIHSSSIHSAFSFQSYPSTITDNQIGSRSFCDNLEEVCFSISSVLGIGGFFFNATIVQFSGVQRNFDRFVFSTVVTTEDTKRSSIVSGPSKCPDLISRSS